MQQPIPASAENQDAEAALEKRVPRATSKTQPLARDEQAALLLPQMHAGQTGPLQKALRGYSFQERRALLVLGDALLVGALYALITPALLLEPTRVFLPFGVFVTLSYLVAFWMLDLYNQATYHFWLSQRFRDLAIAHLKGALPLLSRAVLLATLVVGTVSFFRAHWFPVQPKALAILAVCVCLSLSLWRLLFFRIFQLTLGKKRAIVVGAGLSAQDLVLLNRQYPQLGYEIVGFVDDDPELFATRRLGLPVLGGCRALPALIRHYDCSTLFLGITGSKSAGAVEVIADCLASGVEIVSASDLYERHFGIVPLRSINHSWFVYNLSDVNRGLYLNLKRLIDLSVAVVGLVAAAPVMALVALAVKLDSPGPVLYSQIRVGRRGKDFRIYKFRSMRTDAEAAGAVWAQKNDPRITRLGGFLRKTRLDELPQLWNVLKGDLSVVGPRPERPEFVRELKNAVPYYDRRHMVKPGLTGWAQVRFMYGASVHDAFDKLQYDFFYIKNRSIVLDLEIIVRTAWVVLMRKGAR